MAGSAPQGRPGPPAAGGDNASGILFTKNTFLHIAAPPTVLRRESSAPPSITSSSSRPDVSDSSAIFERLDQLLQPGVARPSEDLEDSGSDGELLENATGADQVGDGTSAAAPPGQKKHTRTCKGKRDRIKRFVSFAENWIIGDPSVNLRDLNPPKFIAQDEVALGRMMEKLAAFQATVRRGELPAGHAQQPGPQAGGAASSSDAVLVRPAGGPWRGGAASQRYPQQRNMMSL